MRLIDIYKEISSNNELLLTNYSSDFWLDYIANHQTYDRIFARRFASRYHYSIGGYDASIDDWTQDVYGHLLLNDARYHQLWRVHVVPDSEYAFKDNYDVLETMERNTTNDTDNMIGVTEYETRHSIPEHTETIGAVHTRETERAPETEVDTTNSVYPENNDHKHKSDNSNTVTSTLKDGIKDSNTDEYTNKFGAQIITDVYKDKGRGDNIYSQGKEVYELRRKGNIGVQTATDVIRIHCDFWINRFNFYNLVFDEINAELLNLVD